MKIRVSFAVLFMFILILVLSSSVCGESIVGYDDYGNGIQGDAVHGKQYDIYYNVLNAESEHAHALIEILYKEPNCTDSGQKVCYTCSGGNVFADSEGKTVISGYSELVIPALGHVYDRKNVTGSIGKVMLIVKMRHNITTLVNAEIRGRLFFLLRYIRSLLLLLDS